MYDHDERQILLPEEFIQPFGGTLNPKNRWCRMALMTPWWEIQDQYIRYFKSLKYGQKANSVRCALGTLIIQEKLGLTDEETVEQIVENPYLQYFLGFKEYKHDKPFDSSILTRFRKRLSKDVINEVSKMIAMKMIEQQREEESEKKKDDNDQPPKSGGTSSEEGEQMGFTENEGKLILDATCAPADIHYPTDLWLLNEAREKAEEIIDKLHVPFKGKVKKPRTYRNRARKEYLSVAKKRKPSLKKIKAGIKKQLQYLERDIKSIHKLIQRDGMELLDKRRLKNLYVIQEVARQQRLMRKNKNHSVPDRIVNIAQPHIRPIVRGKAKAAVEFGAKLSISVVRGYVFMEELSFDSYNEGTTLIDSVERYKKRFGCYPEAVLADQIYRNRENLRFCKEHGIKLSGPKLGRPKVRDLKKHKQIAMQDASERNQVEGKFGEGKRRYGLNLIRTKRKDTSETTISMQLLIMNIERSMRLLLRTFIELVRTIGITTLKPAFQPELAVVQ